MNTKKKKKDTKNGKQSCISVLEDAVFDQNFQKSGKLLYFYTEKFYSLQKQSFFSTYIDKRWAKDLHKEFFQGSRML